MTSSENVIQLFPARVRAAQVDILATATIRVETPRDRAEAARRELDYRGYRLECRRVREDHEGVMAEVNASAERSDEGYAAIHGRRSETFAEMLTASGVDPDAFAEWAGR